MYVKEYDSKRMLATKQQYAVSSGNTVLRDILRYSLSSLSLSVASFQIQRRLIDYATFLCRPFSPFIRSRSIPPTPSRASFVHNAKYGRQPLLIGYLHRII